MTTRTTNTGSIVGRHIGHLPTSHTLMLRGVAEPVRQICIVMDTTMHAVEQRSCRPTLDDAIREARLARLADLSTSEDGLDWEILSQVDDLAWGDEDG